MVVVVVVAVTTIIVVVAAAVTITIVEAAVATTITTKAIKTTTIDKVAIKEIFLGILSEEQDGRVGIITVSLHNLKLLTCVCTS